MSERQSKNTQDKHERILNELVKQLGNESCADCGAKNPRWASHSLGVFLCIRCAGIHRKMGTHISKVKSITMDQWTMEQIEVMRNSGGNNVVNSKINPNPGNHPRPLVDDEHAIERYIRAKWEKRLFLPRATAPPTPPQPQSQPQQHSSSINPAINRLQVLPKRSSSVPTNNGIDPHFAELNQLRDMGFKDPLKNKQVLIQTQGKLDAAIEILTRSQPPPTTLTTNMMTDEQKMDQLMKLGFMDKQQNMEALRRAGGNTDVAMTILNETKFAGQVNQFRSNSVPVVLPSSSTANLLIDVVDSMSLNQQQQANPFAAATMNMQQQFQQQQMLQQQQQLQLQQQQQLQLQQQEQLQLQQQQQQLLLQQQQQQQQSTIFNNPFGLSTIPTNALVFNNQPLVSTPSAFQPQPSPQQQPAANNAFQSQLMTQQQTSNPFSQMTTNNVTTNTSTTSYFNQPLVHQPQQLFGGMTQQPPQPQQPFNNNPWTPASGGSLF